MKRDIWKLCRAGRLPVLAAVLLAHPLIGQPPKELQVFDVSPRADRATAAKAAKAYKQGNIIRVLGATEADVIRLFESKLGTFKVFQASREAAMGNAAAAGEPLKLQAAAGYEDAQGVVHTVQSFAPKEDTNTKIKGKWREHLNRWIVRERAKAAQTQVGDPEPPQQAWTTLYTTTIQATSGNGNFQQNTISVYRLITLNPQTDYYMVYSIPETIPNFDSCNGFDYCGWHTNGRNFVTSSPQATALTDHGPQGTQSGETVGFNIGGSLSPDGPGASAAFSASWYQPDVTTTDTSNGLTASWQEAFHFEGIACNPVVGNVPPESSSTFFSRQGAIFQVPGGTNSFTASVQATAQFCMYTDEVPGWGFHWDSVSIAANLLLGPPQLYASPSSLTIPAGESGMVLVSSFIPDSPEGFAWNVTSNQSWLTVPSSGPFSTSQPIPVSVAAGTPNGSTGTISIDSVPPFAAPSVESGPIEIKIMVGPPSTQNTAGVLLFGGVSSGNTVAATPEIYDIASKQILPTATPIFAATAHSATQLQNGDILIAGGSPQLNPNVGEPSPVIATAQLFHPATQTFSATGSMNVARASHAATLLPDGKVLITGGMDSNGVALNSAEVYDPATATFTLTAPMQTARFLHTASLIGQSGQPAKVLVYSGDTSGNAIADTSAEVWSEASGTFSPAGPMPVAQTGFPQPLPIANGDLVIAGGYDSNFNSIETETLLNPGSGSFQGGSNLNVGRFSYTLTALPAPNELIAIGGAAYTNSGAQTLGSAEVRDANGWTLLSGNNSCPAAPGCLGTPRSNHTGTLLPDGTVLVAGGVDQNTSTIGNTEIFNPSTNLFSPGPVISRRAYHSATFFATSTTTLNVSPNPASPGQTVTMSATLTSLAGTAGGTIQFFDGQNLLSSAQLQNGQASFSTKNLGVGSHSLTAVYSGNGVPTASKSAAVTETVNKANTTVGISSSPNPAAVSQSVTFSASVTPSSATGTITFRDGAVVLATPALLNGVAQFSTSSLTVGQHPITAAYSGDNNNAPTTSPVFTQTVGQDTTTTSLRILPKNATYGQTMTFMARVSSPEGAPAGSVTFQNGTATLGSVGLSSGVAMLTKTLPAGSYNITATYTGSGNYSSSSASAPTTVQQATPNVSVASSLNPAGTGSPVTFTATVSYTYGTPSGSVVFKNGTTPLGPPAPLSNGSANITTPNLAAGNHSITAVYSGDSNFLGATSQALSQVVNRSTPGIKLSSSLATSNYAQPVTFTAILTATNGTPTGSVTFLDGTTTLSSAPLVNGQAQMTTSTLSVGPHSITAFYPGNAVFGPVTSVPLTLVVNPSPTTVTVSSSANPAEIGTNFVLTATVSTQYGTPTGTVTFYNESQVLGPAQLQNGKANLTTYFLVPGTKYITAKYAGNANYQSSTSPPYPQSISVTARSR